MIDGQTYLMVESSDEIFTYTTSNISDSYFSSRNEGRIEVIFSIRDFNTNEILSSQSADLTLISEWLEKSLFFNLRTSTKIKNFEPWLLLTASFPSSIPSQLFATEQFEFEVNTNFIQFFDANDRLEFIWDFGDGDSPRQGFKNYPCWGRRGQIDLTIEIFGVQNPLRF